MSQAIPPDLRYTNNHTWVRILKPGCAEVGITDHAQSQLGDLVSTQLPQVGKTVQAGVASAVVESAKTTSEVESPVTGTVTANNAALIETPDLVNDSPYEKGWLYRVTLSAEPSGLLCAVEYAMLVGDS